MTRPIRTLIADDEPAAREAIELLLATDPEIEVVGSAGDGPATVAALQAEHPDLVFLDVQMPGFDGFEALRQVPPPGLPAAVVFVTAYDRYALHAFEAHALDYLLKPFDDDRFRQAVDRAKARVREARLGARSRELLSALQALAAPAPERGANPGPLRRLMIRKDGRVTILPVQDVDWVEADGDNLRIHAGRAVHVLRDTMANLERALDPARFVRVHRSTIVNLERIQALEPYFRGEYVMILRDGTRLKLSRGSRERLVAALGQEF